jgi:serine O-acetyltransferase
MLDHIHIMDRRMEAMSIALEEHGITRHFEHLSDLEGCTIDPAMPESAADAAGAQSPDGDRKRAASGQMSP